uniref:Transmembrane protein 249 n=1 Tax=Pelusios castaneus TaxID=367368 RepID=A0A8C8RGC7_9SAUR
MERVGPRALLQRTPSSLSSQPGWAPHRPGPRTSLPPWDLANGGYWSPSYTRPNLAPWGRLPHPSPKSFSYQPRQGPARPSGSIPCLSPLQGPQDYSGFFIYGSLVGFWLLLSSLHKRHLVINHSRGCYQIYIKRRLWAEGPLHQIYVRLSAQQDAYGKLFYSLIINGYGLEVLALASQSDKYEQMEFLGRRIARKLNLNYFDYLDVSGRHIIRHAPPPRKDSDLEV